MIFSKGTKYRMGVRIKEFGERMAHKMIVIDNFFLRLPDRIIKIGNAMKESVFTPISELEKR